MNQSTVVFIRQGKKIFLVLSILFFVVIIQSCYHYRVLNTRNDPGTEYRDTVMRSYFWGLINKPQNFHVPNCTDSCAALDEVVFSKNFGQSLLTVITVGIVAPVKVEWKCHKPCQRVIEGL
jgi:Bor protein